MTTPTIRPRPWSRYADWSRATKCWQLVSPMGTAMNTAIRPYLNSRKVPQLFVVSGSPKFNDPKHYPWTMGWVPSNSSEGAIYGALVVKNKPNAKIAVLYQNDDFGRDFLNGFKAALGDNASQIVATEYYDVSDPTVDSESRFTGCERRGCLPQYSAAEICRSSHQKSRSGGLEATSVSHQPKFHVGDCYRACWIRERAGIISSDYTKSASDPTLKDDPGIKKFESYVAKYLPGANKKRSFCHERLLFRADHGGGSETGGQTIPPARTS